jgi:hypothetical protein
MFIELLQALSNSLSSESNTRIAAELRLAELLANPRKIITQTETCGCTERVFSRVSPYAYQRVS